MDINFLLRCSLSLALAKVLLVSFPKSKSISQASFWISLWAIMSGLLAFFADNPYGYPKLRSGSIHLLIAFIAFVAALVAMVMSRRIASSMNLNRNYTYCLVGLTGISIISLILMLHAGFSLHSLGGLYERLFLASVLIWEVILALSVRTEKDTSVKHKKKRIVT